MDVRLLNGNIARLNLAGRKRRTQPEESKSRLQHDIGVWLAAKYPCDQIYEEVRVPREGFVLDFFIPSLRIVVECNGRQHDEFVPYFHGTRQNFVRQQLRDRRKADWCARNGFSLVKYSEKDIHNGKSE